MNLQSPVYIAGPMRGIPSYNFPEFDLAKKTLESQGLTVVSPADLDREVGFDAMDPDCLPPSPEFLKAAMKRDLDALRECKSLVLLDGWSDSLGASLEGMFAEFHDIPSETMRDVRSAISCGASITGDDDDGLTVHGPVFSKTVGGWHALAPEPAVPVHNGVGESFLDDDDPGTTGPMRTFDTGATRDTDEGKLDYEGFLSPWVLRRFAEYMHENRIQADGNVRDSDNWQKGIPKEAYMKSLWRHFMDVWSGHRGDSVDMLESLMAVIFNAQGYAHELLGEEEDTADMDRVLGLRPEKINAALATIPKRRSQKYTPGAAP